MKLKRYFIPLLSLAFWASCSNDNSFAEMDNTQVSLKEVATFSAIFPGRTVLPNTYAGETVNPIKDGDYQSKPEEKKLSSVKIYVFNNVTQTGSDKPGNLVAIEDVDMTTSSAAKFYLHNLFGEKAHFVAVANVDFSEEKLRSLIGKPFGVIADQLVTQYPWVANNFPMVSVPQLVEVPQKGKEGTNKTFLMERLSVRIDVLNKTGKSGAPKLKVTRFRAPKGALNQSYLFNTLATPLAHGQGTTRYLHSQYDELVTMSPVYVPELEGDLYAGGYYTYENGKDEFEFEVGGYFGAELHMFRIPFHKKLIRNTRYLVVLEDDPGTTSGKTVKYTVKVLDWEQESAITMSGDEMKHKPTVTKLSPANASGTTSITTPPAYTLGYTGSSTELADLSTITLGNTNAYNLRLVLKSNVDFKVDGPLETMVKWVTIESKDATELGETADGQEVKAYHLKIAENHDTYERRAKLIFYTHGNKNIESRRREITIVQPAAQYATTKNPLALFANELVGDLNKLTNIPVTLENADDPATHGKAYQWGRNVALDLYKPITIVDKTLEFNNPLLKKENTIYGPGDWTKEILSNTDTWAGTVKKLEPAGTYCGKNNGDPSKVGYRIPKLGEVHAIFPFSVGKIYYWNKDHSLSANSESSVSTMIRDESLQCKLSLEHNKATKAIFYAITMEDGTTNKYRTAMRYEFIPGKGLLIKARYIGNDLTTNIAKVKKENWWNDKEKWGSDVVRVLPRRAHWTSFFVRYDLSSIFHIDAVQQGEEISPLSFGWGYSPTHGYYMLIFPYKSTNTLGIWPIKTA